MRSLRGSAAAGRRAQKAWYAIVEASGFDLNDASWSVLRAWGSHDPLEDLGALTGPTLVILGGDDVLVPVESSLVRYEGPPAWRDVHRRSSSFPAPTTDFTTRSPAN